MISGHLNQERALGIFNIALKSIDHTILNEDDILTFESAVRIPDKTVYEIS
jgi:hypothetical protein